MRKGKFLLLLCFLCFCASPVFGFSTHNTTTLRTFDKVEVVAGESITVIVRFINGEANVLRGFYYTEQISEGLFVDTISVKIDGSDISCIVEADPSGDVYPGLIPYRWVLETSTDFAETNPISPRAAVEVVYTVTSSQAGVFNFSEFNWVGSYRDAPVGTREVFGYSEESDRQTITFTAPPQPPVASFSGTPRTGIAPLEVSFTDLSTGAIESWSWTFGDGGTSTLQDPVHTYNAPGDYTVTLQVTGPGGTDTKPETACISVKAPPSVTRAFDSVEAVVGESITVTVTLKNGAAHDLRGFYYTEQIPEGLWVSTSSVKINGSDISYIVESDPSGDVYPGLIPYRWVLETPADFEDNNPLSPNSTVEIVYSITSSQAGVFNFDEFNWVGYYRDATEGTREVFGYSEESDRQTIMVTVPPQPPVAGFSGTPRTGTAPLLVSFTDLSTGAIENWSWSFGDGETSTERNPTYIYNSPGDYSVALQVMGPRGTDTRTEATYVTVAAPPQPPVAYDHWVITDEDTMVSITLVASNVDGDPLSYSVVAPPSHGILSGTAPNLTYSPATNYYGSDSFTYRAYDGLLYSNVATVTITVTAMNDVPIALNDAYSMDEDTVLTVSAPGVLENDSDVDNPSLTVVLGTGPLYGGLTLNGDGSFVYIPGANFNGSDIFTYRAYDGTMYSNEAMVTIAVNSVNDVPVALNDAYSMDEDTVVTVPAPGVLGNDSDVDGDPLTAILASGPNYGTLTLRPDGAFTYTPVPNFSGTDSFTYRANDGLAEANVATATITIRSVNDPPIANSQSITIAEDTPVGITLTASDVNGDTLTYSVVIVPAHGTLTGTPPNVTYTPAANYNGLDSFTFKANDGSLDSNTATVTIRVSIPPEPVVLRADALVLVNSGSPSYPDFQHYIQPYLEHFGIPYTVLDIATTSVGSDIGEYAVIIVGHRQLDTGNFLDTTEQGNIAAAVNSGVGLVNFDNNLSVEGSTPRYQFVQDIFGFGYTAPSSGSGATFASSHYVTALHEVGESMSTGSMTMAGISLLGEVRVLATTGSQPLLVSTTKGEGRAVQWGSYGWMSHSVKGPMYGLDDLVWRSIVWAARKPFVMQGLPPFVTMRMVGYSGPFWWIPVANEFGFKPWAGLHMRGISETDAAVLSGLIHAGQATAAISSFDSNNLFYFEEGPWPKGSDWPDGTIAAHFAKGTQWYLDHNIPISKFLLPRNYELGTNAFQGLSDWGVEFVGTVVNPGEAYGGWGIMNGPYHLYEPRWSTGRDPVYYADFMTIPGHPEFNGQFFNCLTEIRDDPDFEWCPTNDVVAGIAINTRHAMRALDGMALATLTLWGGWPDGISPDNWRAMLQGITENLVSYNPVYVTMDEACQYIRAMHTSDITGSSYDSVSGQLTVTLRGQTDMPTKFYLFTEREGEISQVLVDVPTFSGSASVNYTLVR